MDHDGHVCAALPVSALHLSVWACHAHQAYVLGARGETQHDQDLSVWWRPALVELGPFDGLVDLEAEATAMAARLTAHLPDLSRRLRS